MIEAIESGWVAPAGPNIDTLEKLVSERSERKFSVALSSGTAALHLGLLAARVRPGDFVVTSSLTFVATANAIRYVGATPIFVDSVRETGNMCPDLLEQALRDLRRKNKQAAAVLPVDLFGAVAQYGQLEEIAGNFEVAILADSAEAMGSTQGGRPAGSFGFGAAFSFNGNKIITTSGGGAFVTDDEQAATTVRYLSTQAREPVPHYEHKQIGFNYRLSNILASIGVGQFARLDELVERRRQNRRVYREIFEDWDGVEILGKNDEEDNCWLTVVRIRPSESGFDPQQLASFLDEREIESRPVWKPMHLQPVFHREIAYLNGESESLFSEGLVLPSGSTLDSSEWDRIRCALSQFRASVRTSGFLR